MTQAVAAREDEVSHFQKLGQGMVPPVFVMASPVSLSLRSLSYHPVLMLATMGSALMLGCPLRLFVFFLIAQFVSIRGFKGGGPLDVSGQWQCGICGAIRCWPTRNQCYKCGQPRSACSCSKVWLVVCLKVFPVLRLLTRVWCMALNVVVHLLNVPKALPHLGVAPLRPQSPLLVLALVVCGLMMVLLHPSCSVVCATCCSGSLPPCACPF